MFGEFTAPAKRLVGRKKRPPNLPPGGNFTLKNRYKYETEETQAENEHPNLKRQLH